MWYNDNVPKQNKLKQLRRNKTMASKKYTIQEMAKAYLDKDMAVIADIGRKHPLAAYQLANMNIAGLEAIAVIPTKVMGKKLEIGLKAMHNIGDVDLEDDGDEPADEVEVEEEEAPKAKKERKSKKDRKSKKAAKVDDDEDEEVVEETEDDEDEEIEEIEEKPAKSKGKKAKKEKAEKTEKKSKKAAKKEADEDDDDDFDFED